MYLDKTCPRCSSSIGPERIVGQAVICECGWTGNKSDFDQATKKPPFKKIALGLSVLAIAFMAYDGQAWGKHYPERIWYKALTALKMTSAKDEARMATVCKNINNHVCAAESYTKALAKSPKSHNLAGALGVELAKVGQNDRAILTFQNFFSYEDGNTNHKRHYAQALSGAGYTDDATAWYYQALQAKSNNFDAAKDLIQHLVKNDNHVEALSVIGHYNTLFPKTRKDWAKLSNETKMSYQAYTQQYDLKEIKISGLSKYLHAPVSFANSSDTTLFMVDPESHFLTLDKQFLQDHGVQFISHGEKELTASNGQTIKGTQVTLPTLNIGPLQLKDVKAVACENCAFMLGKNVMKRLHFQAAETKGVKYITLKQ